MGKLGRSDWSVTAAIHYRVACFEQAAGATRPRRRRQSDEVGRRSVNASGPDAASGADGVPPGELENTAGRLDPSFYLPVDHTGCQNRQLALPANDRRTSRTLSSYSLGFGYSSLVKAQL